jgi:hypothetical protein
MDSDRFEQRFEEAKRLYLADYRRSLRSPQSRATGDRRRFPITWLLVFAISGILGGLALFALQASAAPAAPVILDVSPDHVYNNQSTVITITGAGFMDTPAVLLQSCETGRAVPTNITFVSQTTLTATVPANTLAGNYFVQVINPDGQIDWYHDGFVIVQPGDSMLSSWRMTSPMVQPRMHLAAVSAGNYIYALSGGTIERALVNADGTLGAWQLISTMSSRRYNFSAAVVGHYLYVLGGIAGGSFAPVYESVERAEIYADGMLGPWEIISTMTTPRYGLAAVAAEGYLYALGGSPEMAPPLSSVEWAPLHADGTLGVWQLTAPQMQLHNRAVTARGYLFAPASYGSTLIERAKIREDGSLSAWTTLSSTLTTGRADHAVVVNPNFMVAFGNFLSCIDSSNSVEWAPIAPDGTLGAWQRTASMITPRGYHAAVVVDKYLYALGGSVGFYPEITNSVEYAVLLQQADPQYELVVTKVGAGRITGNPGNIGCDSPETCSTERSYAPGAVVMLTATPATGHAFAGWGGACSGTRVCSVTMDEAKEVVAMFRLLTTGLAVAKTPSTPTAIVDEAGITYTYRITNTAEAALTVQANDDQLGSVALMVLPSGPALSPTTLLQPGQVAVGTHMYTPQAGDLPGPVLNSVIVTGTPAVGGVVTATASATVDLLVRAQAQTMYVGKDIEALSEVQPDRVAGSTGLVVIWGPAPPGLFLRRVSYYVPYTSLSAMVALTNALVSDSCPTGVACNPVTRLIFDPHGGYHIETIQEVQTVTNLFLPLVHS